MAHIKASFQDKLVEYIQRWNSLKASCKWAILAAMASIMLAYIPTLEFDYVQGDQWRAFRYSIASETAVPQTWLDRAVQCIKTIPVFYIQTGRPLVWISECMEHAFVAKISDFRLLRPLVLFIVLFTVLYLGHVLARFTGGIVPGVVATSIFVMTPGYAFMYYHGFSAVMVLLSIIIATASFQVILGISNLSNYHDKRIFLASALFVAACLIYPAYAFIVWIFPFFAFITNTTSSRKENLSRCIWQLSFYSINSVFYYILVKLSVVFLNLLVENPPELIDYYKMNLQLQPEVLVSRLWFAINFFPSKQSLNYNFHSAAIYSILLFFIFNISRIIARNHASSLLKTIKNLFIIFFLFCMTMVFSIAPWLFSQADMINERYILPWHFMLSIVIVRFITLGFSGNLEMSGNIELTLKKPQLFILMSVLLIVSITQNRTSNVYILLHHLPYRFIENNLNEWIRNDTWKRLRYLLFFHTPTTINPNRLQKSSQELSVYENDKVGIIMQIVNAILREKLQSSSFQLINCVRNRQCITDNLRYPSRIVVDFTTEKKITRPVKPYLINLSQISATPTVPEIVIKEMPTLTASTTLGNYDPSGLFYASQPGWHSEKNPTYPQSITIDLKESISMTGFEFLPQDEHTDRMPDKIAISLSENGSSWKEVIATDHLCHSEAVDSWRSLILPEPVSTGWLKITILSNCGSSELVTLRGFRIKEAR